MIPEYYVLCDPWFNHLMSPTANKKTHPETGFEEEYDPDEFEDLLEPVEEFEAANYKIQLKEETLKTNILRKVWQVWDATYFSN